MLLYLPLLAALCLYRKTLMQTAQSFCDPLGCMSHGWLIPIISLYSIYHLRDKLRSVATGYSLCGFFCVLFSVALFWAGCEYDQLNLRQLSLISLIWSWIFAIKGYNFAKLILFPVWFLLFTVSVPSALDELVSTLQNISTTLVFYAMNGAGFAIHKTGNSLSSGVEGAEFYFEVAGSCSGIRSLLALTAFSAVYAWYSQRTCLHKWALFACAFPIAIISNIIRVFSICLVAILFGQEKAIGYYHDYSGYFIAFIAIAAIFNCGNWFKKRKRDVITTHWT